MLFFNTVSDEQSPEIVTVTAVSSRNPNPAAAWRTGTVVSRWEDRWDWKTYEQAQRVAEAANRYDEIATGGAWAAGLSGASPRYIAIDNGPLTAPRYDVIEVPREGEHVSTAFNGDAYYLGVIEKVTPSLQLKIRNTEGELVTARRVRKTGRWTYEGWTVVSGIHNERNPSF